MRRAGLAWREELAAGIVANFGEVDVLELIAERYLDASKRTLQALRFLAQQRPLWIHSTSLGLASCSQVEQRRLDRLARLIDTIEPAGWSEHLAFVRGGGREIGHLASPPRNASTLDGLCRNLALARRATGTLPILENVASLVDPPFSIWSETEWMAQIANATEAGFLLDLHNVHTNATNFGEDAGDLIAAIPSGRIHAIHLAGGRIIDGKSGPRILDDHRSEVPESVFSLLEKVARRPDSFDIIIERDGEFPPVEQLLEEVRRARQIASQNSDPMAREDLRSFPAGACTTIGFSFDGRECEDLLAEIFTDQTVLDRFTADPSRMIASRGIRFDSAAPIDIAGIRMAALSFARKRARIESHAQAKKSRSSWTKIRGAIKRALETTVRGLGPREMPRMPATPPARNDMRACLPQSKANVES